MTVLVVEDDHNVLAFIDRLLTQKGHKVLPAEDPDQARGLLAEHGDKADLLLIDIILPGSNGLDFARAAREEHPALKIIFMTGLVHQSPKVLRSGLGPVLRKPFTSDELLKTMASL
jgi:two-component system, cell cycle sensor histidine kinase and response regulator CckA